MKNSRKRDQYSLKHLHDIENVGLKTECPLTATNTKKANNAQVTEVITWLRLQNHKMGYRLLYCDVAVCCTYIILLFTALRFHAQVFPNRWFYGFTIMLLVGSCMLFIGVHLLPYKTQAVKNSVKTLSEDWTRYRTYFKNWNKMITFYIALLAACIILFVYNASEPSIIIISLLLALIILLYGYGIKMIIKTLGAKEDTNRYMAEAGKTKLATV